MNEQTDQRRGTCPACMWHFALRKDGKLRRHGLTAQCPGSYGPPVSTEPTWRDVIRAMRAAGFKLAKTERISKNWRHRSLGNRGINAGDISTNQLGDRWVTLYGSRDGWTFEMKNPSPAEVLEAARLVGLGGVS